MQTNIIIVYCIISYWRRNVFVICPVSHVHVGRCGRGTMGNIGNMGNVLDLDKERARLESQQTCDGVAAVRRSIDQRSQAASNPVSS